MPDGTPHRKDRTLRSAAALAEAGLIAPAAQAGIEAIARRYAIAVTPAVRALMDAADAGDPIARQYIPDATELTTAPWETEDPTADAPFTPVKGVVHRYPDRALLKPLLACPVYCRFCFRREVVGPDGGLLTEAELDTALDWFARTPMVREAILTGGDPLMLSPRRLSHIIARLSAMPHIDIIRLHSRVPVADPGTSPPRCWTHLPPTRRFFCAFTATTRANFLTRRARPSRASWRRGYPCSGNRCCCAA